MSLKKFNVFIVLISLTIMTLLYLYIAQLIESNIDTQVKNSVRSASIELRQQLRNSFGMLQQRFSRYENTSLNKLKFVKEQLSYDANTTDLTYLADVINTNVYDGHYEIFIINKDKIITQSTVENKLGFDYKDFPEYSNELDQVRFEGNAFKVSAPTFDENTLEIVQYYIRKGEGDEWVMIGFALPFGEYVNYKADDLTSVSPSLQNLDLFILTNDNIQYINKEPQTNVTVSRLLQNKKRFVSMMMSDLELEHTAQNSDTEIIAANFSEHTTTLTHNDEKRESVVYALAASSFENISDDFMLIAKMQFDHEHFLGEYEELKNLLYLFITLIYIFMVLGFTLMYKSVIQKISAIERQMHTDDPIAVNGYLFSEFSYFIERYNNFLLRWKGEVLRLNEITMQDELTKCANRRFFNKKITEQIDLYQRYGQEFSMIMFDIDDFKHINDKYGHNEGDHVLRALADDVRKQLRISDVLCRIGGEEFAIILPETNRESAIFVAEKIREVIAHQIYIDHETITISLGAESYMEEYDFNSFYTTVDNFLYKSKHSGKNCVHSSISIGS